MHQLVPFTILERYTVGERSGNFPAVGLFVDISGFSAMTDALMAHGQHGAEVLAGIIRALFEPLIESVFDQGGFIIYSAGDALTALFPVKESVVETGWRALAAACQIQEVMQARADFTTAYQTVHVSAKVGLASGDVCWGIIEDGENRRAVYFFQGSALDGCANAEHQAKAGQIVLDADLKENLGPQVITEAIDSYFLFKETKAELPPRQPFTPPDVDAVVMTHFFPESLVIQTHSGEFRRVVNMFINLPSVRTETQLRIFMESLFTLQDQYGGLLTRLDFGDKGTTLLLFWGAPTAHENDIQRALTFILKLQAATSIPISAGITYRISHAGYIGGRLHEEYTCFGRGVNLAARFMTASPRGEIWLDEAISQRAEKMFEIEFIKDGLFKGFQEPQKVYVLLEQKEEEQTVFIRRALAGRVAEMEQLSGFIKPIFAGQFAGLLVISGEPGIGKSRLLNDFIEKVQAEHPEGVQTFIGQTDEILRQSFNPVAYWLQLYFGVSSSQSEARNKRSFNHKLDGLIAATPDRHLADELDRTRSFLGAQVGLEWQDSLYEQLDAKGRYQNTQIGLATLILAESLITPVLFALEDTQWLDDDSKAFLAYLLRVLSIPDQTAYPIAIILTSRTPEPGIEIEGFQIKSLKLEGLDRQSLQTLTAAQLKAPFSATLIDLLEARAEGNPFYVEQILHYLSDEGLLQHGPEGWEISGKLEVVPADVNSLLVVRLDRLAQKVKQAIQTASVLGREFGLDLLTRMLAMEEPGEIRPLLLEAEDEAICSALNEMRYIFNHALMRDAAYQMLLHSRRQALHALALEAYERLYAGQLDDFYGALAYHAEQARMVEKACRYLKLAGLGAEKAYQNSLAVEYFSRALAMTPEEDIEGRVEILVKREKIHNRAGNHAARQADITALEAMKPVLQNRVLMIDILMRQAYSSYDGGKFAEAITFASQAAEFGRITELPEKSAEANRVICNALRLQGKLEQAAFHARESLKLARLADSRIEEISSLNLMGLVANDRARLDEAQTYFDQSLQIAREIGNLRAQAPPLNNLGMILEIQGRFSMASVCYQESREIVRKVGDRFGEGLALVNQGFFAGRMGEYRSACEYTEQALKILGEAGNSSLIGIAMVNLSGYQSALGNIPAAIEFARQADTLAKKTGNRTAEAWALTYLGHASLQDGSNDHAIAAYRAALQIREEMAQPELASEPAAGLARAALQRGDTTAALEWLKPVLAHLKTGGKLESADDPLRVYLTCYLALQKIGDPAALTLLETAYGLMMEQAERITDEPTRQAFLNNIQRHVEIRTAWEGRKKNA
jgi:predicted ATPase/class 3 adenylate cyclase